ncbi:hypothetical protein OJAV_G00053600 [Oryzias javanicus]|uniref:Uncharacterized protein n=1 Tax=Oryzias javanicus TaxID=123683 RepID=A0A3S2PC05_ORYJA|nr:hypothetical protein OJAV_G00053600 [Oryzias javanicus]
MSPLEPKRLNTKPRSSRGSSSECCRSAGEQQWSSQREPQWSRTEAEQPTAPLASGDASNSLRGVGC